MTAARPVLVVAGLLGLSGVIMAALGSHAVPGMDDFGNYRGWQSANQMHLLHAIVLLFLSRHTGPGGDPLAMVTAFVFLAGVVLFSGSIYLSQLSPYAGATAVAPAGGVLLMVGWALIAVLALRRQGP